MVPARVPGVGPVGPSLELDPSEVALLVREPPVGFINHVATVLAFGLAVDRGDGVRVHAARLRRRRPKSVPKSVQRSLREGDTFAVPMGEGRFGAVRVIRIGAEPQSTLVAVTPWLGAMPAPTEPLLRAVLKEHRGHFQGAPAIFWVSGVPPREFVHIAVIEPSEEEQTHDPQGRYAGRWHVSLTDRVLFELEASRPLVKRDVAPPPAPSERACPLPVCMAEADFWNLIALLDWTHEGEDERVIEPLVARLASMPEEAISGFHARLCERLSELDREDLARQMGEHAYGSEGFSPDDFLDARCVVVANGRAFYESVLSDPRRMPKDMEFEALLSIATKAFERRTGEAADFAPEVDAATFRNEAGWNRDHTDRASRKA